MLDAATTIAVRRGQLDEHGRARETFAIPHHPRLPGVTLYAQSRTLPSLEWSNLEVLTIGTD